MKTLTILNDDFHGRSAFQIGSKYYAHVSDYEMTTEFWVKLIKELGITVVQKDRDLVYEE